MNQPKADIPLAMKHLTKGKDRPTMGIDARFALSECLRRRSDVRRRDPRAGSGAAVAADQQRRVRLALIDAYLGLSRRALVDAERVDQRSQAHSGHGRTIRPAAARGRRCVCQRDDPKKAADLINKALAANPNDKGRAAQLRSSCC